LSEHSQLLETNFPPTTTGGQMFKRISVKVAFYVNILLLIVLCIGTFIIIKGQDRSVEDQLLQRGKIEAVLGAKITSRILEEAIDNGVLSQADVFDTEYKEIPGFDPPKYHTKYDIYLDKALLEMEDEFFKDGSVTAAVAVDINGYLPTHNMRYQKAITWDKEKDRLGNHSKRVFNDPIGLKAAKNTEVGLLQLYQRDDGEVTWDIAAPIYVKAKHWGNFRIGFSLVKAQEQKNELRLTTILAMSAVFLVSCISVFFMVGKALGPLEVLTARASELADGEIDQPIVVSTTDEIGRLADVLERLRISFKKVLEKLDAK